jgi:hypothetical protein
MRLRHVQGGPSASAPQRTSAGRACQSRLLRWPPAVTHVDPSPLLPVLHSTLINTIRSLLSSDHSSLCAYLLDIQPTRLLRNCAPKTMFCLRSWIPVLFFLYVCDHAVQIAACADQLCSLRTNASPVYLVLFISATYFLNRPCVYCSLLLFILVVALFDFHTPWFDPPLAPDTAELALNGTFVETAGVLAQAANHTAQAIVKNAVDGVRGRIGQTNGAKEYEWVKGLLGKKEWKIQCLDVLIRV